MLALVVLAAVLSTTIAATNGVTTLWLSGDARGRLRPEWLLWWTDDAMGVLLVAPLLFVLATTGLDELRGRRRRWRPACSRLLVAAATVSIGGLALPHVLFPLLVWATLRFRQLGAVVGSFVVAALAVAGGIAGTMPIEESTTEIVQILEGLLAGVAISL